MMTLVNIGIGIVIGFLGGLLLDVGALKYMRSAAERRLSLELDEAIAAQRKVEKELAEIKARRDHIRVLEQAGEIAVLKRQLQKARELS